MNIQITPLYTRIGGEYTINAALDSFFEKVMGDVRINYFFDNVRMDRQLEKLKNFLKIAFGEPGTYSGLDMRAAHAPLLKKGLNDEHVDILVRHMEDALEELSVEMSLIREVSEIIESCRDDVLNR